MFSGYFVYVLAKYYGTFINFRDIFRIVTICNPIFLFFSRLKTFSTQKKNPRKKLIWKNSKTDIKMTKWNILGV